MALELRVDVLMDHWAVPEVYPNWDAAMDRKEELIRNGARYEDVRLKRHVEETK